MMSSFPEAVMRLSSVKLKERIYLLNVFCPLLAMCAEGSSLSALRNFSVDISTTSTDLNDEAHWEQKYSQGSNRFYHVLSAEERRAIDAEKRRLAR